MDPQTTSDQFDEEQERLTAVSPLEIVGFVVRSARRHLAMSISVGVTVLAVSLLAARTMPQWYQSEARILVEDSVSKIANLSNSYNPQQRGTEDPVAESTELVLQKANLEAVVTKLKLVDNWEANLPWPIRQRDKLTTLISGTRPSDSERVEVLAKTLASRILTFKDKNVVSLQVQWRDPQLAQLLAKELQGQLFLTLQTQDFSLIAAAITLLENQAKQAAELIPAAREAVTRARSVGMAPQAEPLAHGLATSAAATGSTTATTGNKKSGDAAEGQYDGAVGKSAEVRQADRKMLAKLADIREQIKATEIPWQRRLAELKLQKADLQVTYGPEHPLVLQQESRIKAASEQPTELQRLRANEQELLSKIQSTRDDSDDTQDSSHALNKASRVARGFGNAAPKVLMPDPKDDANNPAVVAAMDGLKTAVARYNDLATRVDSARFELNTAQVAFQHRYVVVSEPEIPRRPVKRLHAQVAMAGVAAALLLGLLIGAIRDLLSGRILEPWQVKNLGLQVLGDLRLMK